MHELTDRIYGSLTGLVLADAAGACFEGLQQKELRSRFASRAEAFKAALERDALRYTDDGQMALAVAEHLAENSTIDSHALMRRFVEFYESWRGYGRGARVLIEAFRDHADYEFMAEHLFPGGSLGNGAAMRSAPVGLKFHGDPVKIWLEARHSAWPTHRHELGIEGAQLIASAASFAITGLPINPRWMADHLLPLCSTVVFQNRLRRLRETRVDEDVEQFGNGIEAHESVVTAIACFSMYPDDYERAVSLAIWQGGDTDTIAAMTGALVGAHVGSEFTKRMPLDRLEDGEAFTLYVRQLADRLAG